MEPWSELAGSDDGAEALPHGEAASIPSREPSSAGISATSGLSDPRPTCVVDLAGRSLKQLHDLYQGISEVRRAASRRGARGRSDCALDASQQRELAGKALATIARAQFLRDQRRGLEARAKAAELEELDEVMVELNAESLESECIVKFGKHDDLDPEVMELTARIREIRSQKRAVETRRRALRHEESDEEGAEEGMEEGAEEEGEEELALVGGRPDDVVALFLHGNALRTLVGVGIFRHLRKLDVANNMLRVLPHAAWWREMPALEVIYLHGNHLERVEELAPLRALPSLMTITLSRNPLASTTAYRARTIALLCEATQLASLDARLVTEDERLEALYDARSVPRAARACCRLARSPWADFAATARRGGGRAARAMAPQYRRNALASDHYAALLAETGHARSVWTPRASPAALLQRSVRMLLVATRWRRRVASVCLLQLRCRAWLHRAQTERELRHLLAAAGMSELLVHPMDRRIRSAVLKLQRSYVALRAARFARARSRAGSPPTDCRAARTFSSPAIPPSLHPSLHTPFSFVLQVSRICDDQELPARRSGCAAYCAVVAVDYYYGSRRGAQESRIGKRRARAVLPRRRRRDRDARAAARAPRGVAVDRQRDC